MSAIDMALQTELFSCAATILCKGRTAEMNFEKPAGQIDEPGVESGQMPETAQLTPETDEKKSRGLGSYALWAVVVVMVYVLSSRPMSMFAARSDREISIITVTYLPLSWAYLDTPLHKPLGLYWHLWSPTRFDRQGEQIPIV